MNHRLRRIGSIRPPFKLRALRSRDKSHQSLVQTATYPTEFEPQTPSNSALARSQAHHPMPLARSGHIFQCLGVGLIGCALVFCQR